MPELQEVFRMATQKVDQEPGALERQVVEQRKAVRNRRVGAVATVVVIVVAAGAVFALTRNDTQGGQPAHSTSIAPSIVPGIVRGSMLDLRTGKITHLPASIATSGDYFAVSPDHTMVAFNRHNIGPGRIPVYVSNVDGTQRRSISASGWDGYDAQWSPDGSMLVYQQRNGASRQLGNLFVWNAATGRRTQVTNFDQTQWDDWQTLPSFAPDGRSILFQLPRGNNGTEDLWSVPVTGGKQTLVRRNAGEGYYSPDGMWLAYQSDSSLWITGAHGGAPWALVRGANPDWVRWSPDGTRISYTDNGSIHVVNVATGSATKVAEGGRAEWFDDNTLIVAYPAS
jgi:Tol biopolymer transport system component